MNASRCSGLFTGLALLGLAVSLAAPADADTGAAVGTGGTILRTTEGGATWTPQSSGTIAKLQLVR